jgi:hypothetical protein
MRSLVFIALIVAARAASNADSWSVTEVNKWVDEQGLETAVSAKIKEGFTKHNVDGTVLLHITEEDVKDDLGIESGIQRKKVMAGIEKLKSANTNHGKMDFWQYRSMNRKQMDGLMFLLSAAPRWAIHNFQNLPPHGQPKPLEGAMGWLEWLVFPNYHIYVNSNEIAGGLPGFLPFIILGNFVAKILKLFGTLVIAQSIKGTLSMLGTELAQEIGAGIFNWIWMNIFWPFVPAVICDMFFYIAIYLVPLALFGFSLIGVLTVFGLFAVAASTKLD